MLILARRQGERVVIGDEILVTVMEVSGSTVRLGIEAPQGVSIFREEIWLAVKEENRAAAAAQADALASLPVGEVAASSPGTASPGIASPDVERPSEAEGAGVPDSPRGALLDSLGDGPDCSQR
jgi:carbon storage regulator